jgi:hypothetical protein
MKNQVSNARTSFSPVFLRIVKENHKKVLSLDVRLKKLEVELSKTSGEDDVHVIEKKIRSLEDELAKASSIVIVFSAMVLESYIYDYSARRLTDSFVTNHLDKLDTLSKWIIVLVLITGKEMPQRPNWRELLKKLIKARNSIIHHKSSQPPATFHDTKKYLEKLQENSETLLEAAKQSTRLLKILADKIMEIDPQESAWVKAYLI